MHFASMTLGLFDWLIEWLTQFLVWLIGLLIDLLMEVLAELFYAVGKYFLQIVDWIQMVFRRLSGLENFYMDGKAIDADPLLTLMANDTVMQVLTALSFVAVLMLILITIIQVIKVEFNSDGKNSKTTIIGQSLRALLMFAVVPICCVGGVIACNALLRVIDRATALGSSTTTMGAQIMASSVSSANYLRLGSDYEEEASEIPWSTIGVSSPNLDTAANKEKAAKLIDSAFRNNDMNGSNWSGEYGPTNQPFLQTTLVRQFYEISEINYIIFIGGALLAAYTMLMASFGMVMRLYKGVILFIISPPLVALIPLDGGHAFKSWRTKFLGQVLAAYGTIVSLNLLFIILPIVNNIDLFGMADLKFESAVTAINNFCRILFVLTALFTLKDISNMISGLIGAEDAAASGSQVASKVGGTVAKIGLGAAGVGAKALGGIRGGILNKKAGSLSKQLEKETDPGKREALKQQLANTQAKMRKNDKVKAFGRKNTAIITGGLAGVAKNLTGGVVDIQTGEQRYKTKQDEIKAENEAREARVKAGTASTEDLKLEAKLKDPTSRASRKRYGGARIVDKAIERAGEVDTKVVASQSVATNMKSEYTRLETATGSANVAAIRAALASGDSFGASSKLDQMIQALNAMTSKTEEQKDLLSKLTLLQGQINSAGGDRAALNEIRSSSSFSDISTSILTENRKAVDVNTSTAFSVSFDSGNLETEIDNMTQTMVEKLKGLHVGDAGYQAAFDKMKREILTAQKAEVEKLAAEKDSK